MSAVDDLRVALAKTKVPVAGHFKHVKGKLVKVDPYLKEVDLKPEEPETSEQSVYWPEGIDAETFEYKAKQSMVVIGGTLSVVDNQPDSVRLKHFAQTGLWGGAEQERTKFQIASKSKNLSAGDKLKAGKLAARFDTLARASRFAAAMQAHTLSPDQIDAELAYLQDRMGSDKAAKVFTKSWPVDMYPWFVTLINAAAAEKKHIGYKEEIGFDLDDPTVTKGQLMQWVKGKGGVYVGAMTKDELKDWIKAFYGDPDTISKYGVVGGQAVHQHLQEKGKQKLLIGQLKASAGEHKKKQVEASINGPDADSPEAHAAASAAAAFELALKKDSVIANLKTRYERTTGAKAFFVQFTDGDGEYEWRFDTGDISTVVTEDEVLTTLIKVDGWEEASQDRAVSKYYTDLLAVPSYGTAHPTDWNKYIKERGGNYTGKMSMEEKKRWVRFHLMGNEFGKFEVERRAALKEKGKGFHKWADTHPGSPKSSQGKLSMQQMVDFIQTRPYVDDFYFAPSASAWNNHNAALFLKDFNVLAGTDTDPLPSAHVIATHLQNWLNFFPKDELPPPTAGIPKAPPPPPKVVEKPENVSDVAWTLLEAIDALPDDYHVFAKLSPKIDALSDLKLHIEVKQHALDLNQAALVSKLPRNIQKAYLYARVPKGYDPEAPHTPPDPEGIVDGIIWRTANNLYVGKGLWNDKGLHPKDEVVPEPKNPYVPIVISNPGPGMDYILQPGERAMKSPNVGSILIVHADGVTGTLLGTGASVSTLGPDWDHWSEFSVELAKAPHTGTPPVDLKLSEVTTVAFPDMTVHDANSDTMVDIWHTVQGAGIDAIIPDDIKEMAEFDLNAYLKQAMYGPKAMNWGSQLSSVPTQKFLDNAPLSAKRYMALSVQHDNFWAIGLMNAKAQLGGYGFDFNQPTNKPQSLYAENIAKGQTSSDGVMMWSYQAISAYFDDHPEMGLETQYEWDSQKAVAIANHYAKTAIKVDPVKKQAPHPNPKKPDKLILHALPDKGMGGMHTKSYWGDQTDKEYMAKSFKSDDNAKARVDAEHNANLIGRLHGFKQPVTHAMKTPAGHYSYVQELLPGSKIVGIPPQDLEDRILFSLANEHVLDWVISNHDSHDDNFIRSPDNKTLIGVDKGQAFKFFPNDKLEVGYLPPGNGAPVHYDAVYKAIINHDIDKDRADTLVTQLLQKAKRVATQHEAAHRKLLEDAFKARTQFPNGLTREEFIERAMERKKSAPYDFEALYKKVYEQAGYEWTIPAVDDLSAVVVETPDGGVYSGISHELLSDVGVMQIHGVPAFFGGTEIEDIHMLVYEEKEQDGGRLLVGELRVREQADKKVESWLNSQTVTALAGVEQNLGTGVDPAATLPSNDLIYNAIVTAAKTVNHHASDGEYNQSALSTLEDVRGNLVLALKRVKDEEKLKPGVPVTTAVQMFSTIEFHTLEQQAAWKEMASQYLGYIDDIQYAHLHTTKTPKKNYGMVSYVPKPKAKVVNEWEDTTGDQVIQELDDGTWVWSNKSSGEADELPEKEAKAMLSHDDWSPAQAIKGTNSSEPLKLFKKLSRRPAADLELESGILKHVGGDAVDVAANSSQPAYEVVQGDISIEYRPHSTSVPAHKGLMRIRVRNFNGDDTEVHKALDLARTMGLNLSPADETELELFYWRHLLGVAHQRKKPPAGTTKGDALLAAIAHADDNYQKNPMMTPVEELQMLREAWSLYLGEDGVAKADTMPKLGHPRIQNPEMRGGHPYWLRPDVTEADILKAHGNHKFIRHSIYTDSDAKPLAKSGMALPTEERTRVLGKWAGKSSSSSDQGEDKGSSLFLFTSTNKMPDYGGHYLWLSPTVARRTQTYSFPGDGYGKLSMRSSYAPWDTREAMKFTDSSTAMSGQTETMVKYALTVLDDVEVFQVSTQSDANDIILFLKKYGIHEIRGVPIEERIAVGTGDANMKMKALWERWQEAVGNAV